MSNVLIKYTLILVALATSALGFWSVNISSSTSAYTAISSESTSYEISGCARALTETSHTHITEFNSAEPAYSSGRRSFSFHYLDILELLFSAKNDAVKAPRPQPPSTSNAA